MSDAELKKRIVSEFITSALTVFREQIEEGVKDSTIKRVKEEIEKAFIDPAFSFKISVISKEVWNGFWEQLVKKELSSK